MTIEELNAMLENLANNSSDDALMLETFDKIRTYIQEINDKMATMIEEMDQVKANYEKLRETKVRDFFDAKDESEDVEEEKVEEVVEETPEITLSDLFEEDAIIDDLELDIEEKDEEEEI